MAFLDADDWFAPNRLEILLQLAASSGTDLVADDIYLIQDGMGWPWGTTLSNHDVVDGEQINIIKFITMDCGLQPMIRRDFLLGNNLKFDEKLRTGEDDLLIIDCLLRGSSMSITTLPLYYYRIRPGSLSGDRIGSLVQSRSVFESLLCHESTKDVALQRAVEEKLVKIKNALNYYRVMEPLRHGNISTATREALRRPIFFVLLFKSMPVILRHRVSLLWHQLRPRKTKPERPGLHPG